MALTTRDPDAALSVIDLQKRIAAYGIKNVFPRLRKTGASRESIDLLPARSI